MEQLTFQQHAAAKTATYRVLNLYACLGGNRLLWNDCQVTAVELDAELAKLYQIRFPNDKVIVGDAHQYLLEHYTEFDFIWSSPPCSTHSMVRAIQKNTPKFIPKFPDMRLYEEIIFLQNFFAGKYVVENVIPYYTPLIAAKKRGRHLFWCNFNLPSLLNKRDEPKIGKEKNELAKLCEFHKIECLSEYNGTQNKKTIARNLVDYEVGLMIFLAARKAKIQSKKISLFDDVFLD